MKFHFISIGGSVMHNLALALHRKGHQVTGSDDEIYEPSRSRLEEAGLLSEDVGWNASKIDRQLDAVILGMHAREDNPELKKALELGIRIYSYPEYIYEFSKDKKRIVVSGSHGKTTTTAIIMHVLKRCNHIFDYLIGARLEGFDQTVHLSDAPVIIIEGDEYLSSAIDKRPKIMHYRPHIAVLTGIAWDHINVFPTFEGYKEQFGTFTGSLEASSTLFYFQDDQHIREILRSRPVNANYIPYSGFVRNEDAEISLNGRFYRTKIFGKHNDQNLEAAFLVCRELGVSEEGFFKSVRDFGGASRRLQRISKDIPVYFDFAHAPSKVSATVQAIYEKFPGKNIIVFLELHTYSSLNREFIPFYKDSLTPADSAHVFCNIHTFEHKKMEPIESKFIEDCFAHNNLEVIYQAEELERKLKEAKNVENGLILIMSSGNLGGIDVHSIFA